MQAAIKDLIDDLVRNADEEVRLELAFLDALATISDQDQTELVPYLIGTLMMHTTPPVAGMTVSKSKVERYIERRLKLVALRAQAATLQDEFDALHDKGDYRDSFMYNQK